MSPLSYRKERDGCSGDKSQTQHHKDKEKCHHNRAASCGCDRTLACGPKDKDRCSGDSHSDGLSSCQEKQKQEVHVQRSEGSISFKQEGYNTNKLYRKTVQVRNKESDISWIMISELKNENAQLKAELDDRNKASENLCLMYLRMKEKKDQALKELHTLQEHHKQIELRNSCLVDENFGLRKQLQKLKGASEPTDHIQGEEGETRPRTSTPSTRRGPSKKYSKMKHRNKSSPPETDSKMASGDACPTASSSLPTISASREDSRPSEPTRVLSVPDTRAAL
ncbi:uncharacterized protein [Anabrus simplex]|uniref:uncharacterized protein n=1 Tax=Anabrus simplex TaxID=316456 RepID=UPI0034DD82CB